MATNDERQMIIEYWFRVLIGTDITIGDIAKIMVEFANEIEAFVESFCHENVIIEDNGQLIYKKEGYNNECNAFGKIIATPNRMYHWKLKVIECKDDQLNIGVIQEDKAKAFLAAYWWFEVFGFSYFAGNGKLYNEMAKQYGDTYEEGDIIDVWLDLKENKNEISFAKNNKKFGKAANVRESTDYRLAVGMWAGSKKIEILSFKITN